MSLNRDIAEKAELKQGEMPTGDSKSRKRRRDLSTAAERRAARSAAALRAAVRLNILRRQMARLEVDMADRYRTRMMAFMQRQAEGRAERRAEFEHVYYKQRRLDWDGELHNNWKEVESLDEATTDDERSIDLTGYGQIDYEADVQHDLTPHKDSFWMQDMGDEWQP
jgi:hypothetical protein